MGKRLTYQNWIVKLGRDPDDLRLNEIPEPAQKLFTPLEKLSNGPEFGPKAVSSDQRQERIIEAVREGLSQLDENEREFLILFHFMGRSYRQIAESSGREIYRLEALHLRALKQLRALLARFVEEEFDIRSENHPDCPICASPDRDEIDQLIDQKKAEETWSGTIRQIKDRFGIRIKTPQVLIGHKRFH